MKPAGRRLAASLSFLLAMVFAVPAAAGDFQVDPVHVTLDPGRVSSRLTVRNVGAEPVSLRVKAFRWTQEKGEDVYSPTDEVLVSPPIFTTAPGGTQLVRVGLRTARKQGEQAYRLIVEEIPVPRKDQSGINVAVRLNLPFYVMPKGEAKPNLRWSAAMAPDDRILLLTAHNSGALHQQVVGLAASGPGDGRIALSEAMGVVLPGGARTWKVAMPPALSGEAEMQLLIRTPHGEAKTKVALGFD